MAQEQKKVKIENLKGLDRLKLALSYVFPYFKPYWKYTILVAFLAIFSNVFEPSLAVGVKFFMKFVFRDMEPAMVIVAPLSLIILFLIRESTTFLYDYNKEKLSLRVVQDLQCAVYNHFVHLSLVDEATLIQSSAMTAAGFEQNLLSTLRPRYADDP